ncbi:hypothetical protein [Streptomyces sp. NPDC048057]|uniref:hypothetical protein n=1 Tax=Streptomyces sp. NPDC048057 TaxID=3155628 RepID=UPI0033F51094
MAFETSYQEYRDRVARQYGAEEELRRLCPTYARHLATTLRTDAAAASGQERAALLRLADRMDPDLTEVAA